MAGDGNSDGTRYTTKYSRFADDFQELLLKIGRCGRVFKEHKDGRLIYRVKLSKNKAPTLGDPYKKKVFYKKVKYDNYVYDVTVPNHIIFVRRNGFACWSGNCYGPRQNPKSEYSGVISKFIDRMVNDKQPVIYGSGTQSRDFIFVKDVVAANVLAAKTKKAKGEVYNIATGSVISINELVKTLNAVLGKNIEPVFEPERPGDIKFSFADVSLAKSALGFEAKTPIQDGLKETVKWLQEQRYP